MMQDDGSRTLILTSHKVLLISSKWLLFTGHSVLVRVLLLLFETSGHVWFSSLVIPKKLLFDITIN